MSDRARAVLAAVDEALRIRDRHPRLFAEQLRRDRRADQLAVAVDRYRKEKPSVSARPFRDEVEPVDDGWAEAEARRREEDVRRRRLRLNTRERERRSRLTGLELAAEVANVSQTISTVAASSVEPSRGGGDPSGPPRQQRLQDDPRWQLADRIIHRQAMVMRELVDEARGLSHSAAVSALDGTEKDRAIREEGAGLSAEEVFRRLGPEYGSISHIRRKRREWGFDHLGRENA